LLWRNLIIKPAANVKHHTEIVANLSKGGAISEKITIALMVRYTYGSALYIGDGRYIIMVSLIKG
jgi:hypothetical protein